MKSYQLSRIFLIWGVILAFIGFSLVLCQSDVPSKTAISLIKKDGMDDCTQTAQRGRIIYLKNSLTEPDLFIMDHDGENEQFLMSDVSDSPAWSQEGQIIAVGCETDTDLCILDVSAVPSNCEDGPLIQPAIIKKIRLPDKCLNADYGIQSISWSPDSSRLALACGAYMEVDYLFILTLGDESFEAVSTNGFFGRAEWAPNNNRILLSTVEGIQIIDTYGNNIALLPFGFSPVWSPAGDRIAYIAIDEEEHVKGIQILNLNDQHQEQLFPFYPLKQDSEIVLSCGDHREDCRLSWSPDGTRIAFGAVFQYLYNWQIFSLELQSGEVMQISQPHDPHIDRFFVEPSWGQ